MPCDMLLTRPGLWRRQCHGALGKVRKKREFDLSETAVGFIILTNLITDNNNRQKPPFIITGKVVVVVEESFYKI
jgi:hypothetical protein